jgi:hypothetical protein
VPLPGTAATRPRDDNERVAAEREAIRHVPVFAQLLEHFANSKFPESQLLKNTLERPPFSVEPAWSSEVATIFEENARAVGHLQDMSGGSYIMIDAGTAPVAEVSKEEVHAQPVEPDGASESPPSVANTAPSVQQPDPPSVMETPRIGRSLCRCSSRTAGVASRLNSSGRSRTSGKYRSWSRTGRCVTPLRRDLGQVEIHPLGQLFHVAAGDQRAKVPEHHAAQTCSAEWVRTAVPGGGSGPSSAGIK